MADGIVATDEQIAWFEAKGWVYQSNRYTYHNFYDPLYRFDRVVIVGAATYWLVRKSNPAEILPLKFKCPIEAYQWAVLEGLIDN